MNSKSIELKDRFQVLVLKITAIGSRYIFVLLFGKLLVVEDFANYNLLSSLIIFVLYFIGLDYYIHLHRSYHQNNKIFNKYFFKYLLIIAITSIISVIPLLYFVEELGLPWYLVPLICCIPITELIIQEAYRFEILKGNQARANFILFIRYFWMAPCSLFLYVFDEFLPIDIVVVSWIVVNAIYCFYLVFFHYNFIKKLQKFQKINFNKLQKDLVALSPFFLATVSLRLFFFLDKWIPQFFGIDAVYIAEYSFNALFGAGLTAFLDAIMISHFYPKIMSLKKEQHKELSSTISLFYKEIITVSIIILFVSGFLSPFINFSWGEIKVTGSVVFWSLFCMIVYNIALVPHYALFSVKMDKAILISNFLGLSVFILSILLFLIVLPPSVEAIYWSTSLGFLTIFISKYIYFKNYESKVYKPFK